MNLVLCSNCKRHYREVRCPFCSHADGRELPKSASGYAGLSRAAFVASAVAVAACGEAHEGDVADTGPSDQDAAMQLDAAAQSDSGAVDAGLPDTGPDDVDGSIAIYGGPPIDAGQDSGAVPPYGIPPVEDAGPVDAGTDLALYGGPPSDDA